MQRDVTVPGVCIDTAAFYIANGVLNCISKWSTRHYAAVLESNIDAGDLLILALPIPVVWGLAMPFRQKVNLSIVFAFGSVSCIVSIIRLKSIIVYLRHGESDITYDLVGLIIWT